jgi:hypothetical protein
MERPPASNRLVRLRRRSALFGHSALHSFGLPLPNGPELRCSVRSGKHVDSFALASGEFHGKELIDRQTRLALLAFDRSIQGIIAALNAFPLFEVLLRIKEPSRLPGRWTIPRTSAFMRSWMLMSALAGVTFELRESKAEADWTGSSGEISITHMLELKVSS